MGSGVRMITKIEPCFMVKSPPITIVLCPLAFEAQALAPLAKAGLIDVRQIGSGPERIRRAMAQIEAQPDQSVLLAGVASGLDPTLGRGTAVWVNSIAGSEHQPTCPLPAGVRAVRCAQTATLLRNCIQRTLLASSTDADIADKECLAFAQCAGPRPGHWGIVRGISDALDDSIPQLDDWVDDDGNPLSGPMVRHLVTHPWNWPSFIRTTAASTRAMNHVQRIIGALTARV